MVDGPRCLAAFAGTWAYLPRGDGLVEARFRYRIEAARGWRWLEPLMAA
ncbi:hypothetical protein [Chitinimonas koreensis]|nr:hypothetical protein [Chitinimonas koreensis]